MSACGEDVLDAWGERHKVSLISVQYILAIESMYR